MHAGSPTLNSGGPGSGNTGNGSGKAEDAIDGNGSAGAVAVGVRADPGVAVAPAEIAPGERLAREQRSHDRWNYMANALDGGFFSGGTNFVNAATILPTIVAALAAPNWLVSLVPALMGLGFVLPQLLTAHWVARLRRYVPMLMLTGIFQRLPYLAAGVALLWGVNTTLSLAAVILAPFVSGLMGGIGLTGWQQLMVKIVPRHRRSSVFAARYTLAALLGLAASYQIKRILQAHPDATGYGMLHLWAFGLLMLSWVSFGMIREVENWTVSAEGSVTLGQNLRSIPRLLCSSRAFMFFVLFRCLRAGLGILTPFLAIYGRQKLGCGESFVSQLLMAMVIGQVAGNLVGAYLGDRVGRKVSIVLGTLSLIGLAAWSWPASTAWEFQVIFFLMGFGQQASEVGNAALGLEICPVENRSTYYAMMAVISLPAMLLASWASAALYRPGESFAGVALATVVCLTLSLVMLVPLREPHKSRVV